MAAAIRVEQGDMREVLSHLKAQGLMAHACVTDPPYHLTSIVKRFGKANAKPPRAGKDGTGPSAVFKRSARGFMGKRWDGGDIAFQPDAWRAVFDVLRPGGHVLAFGGTRTYHRMACAIEDAGFEMRDAIAWLYATGFPKRPDVLKPAMELIAVARKPMGTTVAANMLAHGVGGLNIEACRIGIRERPRITSPQKTKNWGAIIKGGKQLPDARWPANVTHDGSAEVVRLFPDSTARPAAAALSGIGSGSRAKVQSRVYGGGRLSGARTGDDDVETSAARFFFAAEPDLPERVRRELKRNPKPGRSDGYGMDKGPLPQIGLSFGDDGSAARFFFDAALTTEDIAWMHEPASFAVDCSNLQSVAAVSVLSRVAAQLMPGSVLNEGDYRAPSINATADEFARLCESAIATIQTFAPRFMRGLPQTNITLNLGPVRCAANPTRTDTMTITIAHWKSDGSAAPVTFSITRPSVGHGAVDYVRAHYSDKADTDERLASKHPTIKPVDLMRWLVRLVCPPRGLVLDPFAGSGTTGMACMAEGFDAVLIERESEYVADIRARLAHVRGDDTPLFGQR